MSDRRRFNGRTPRGLTASQRFWSKVAGDSFEDCWLWTAAKVPSTGYACFQLATRKRVNGHRWAYEQMVGEVPPGLHLDHLCRVRHCVNPFHLEPVTPLVNTRRGEGHGHETCCPHRHPYNAANTYRHKGRRYCRTCQRTYISIWRAMTPDEREARKFDGLPVVDLAAYFAEQSQETAA